MALRIPRQLLKLPGTIQVRTYASTTPVHPRHWLPHTLQRIGACMFHGANEEEVKAAGEALGIISREWQGLVLGVEGYIVEEREGERLPVKWGEMVSHVNNVSYIRYAESSRMDYITTLARNSPPETRERILQLWKPSFEGLILRELHTNWKYALTYPTHYTPHHRLLRIHSDSFEAECTIMSLAERRPAAVMWEDIVMFDYDAGKKIKLPKWWRESLEGVMERQEESARRWKKRRGEVEGLVVVVEGCLWRKEMK